MNLIDKGDRPFISKKDLVLTMFRTFLLEAVWNFERMQSVGYCYVMAPVFKKFCTSQEDLKQRLKRSLNFFNTNPYMAGLLFGVLLNMEEKRFQRHRISEEQIEEIKKSFMGPFAALGDNFFWATLRVLAALMGVVVVLIQKNIWPYGVWGVVVFFLIFNIPHITLRFGGLFEGYRKGEAIIDELQSIDFHGIIREVRLIGMIFLGTYLPVWLLVNKEGEILAFNHHPLLRLGTFLGAIICFKFKLTPAVFFCLLVCGCVVGAYFKVMPPLH